RDAGSASLLGGALPRAWAFRGQLRDCQAVSCSTPEGVRRLHVAGIEPLFGDLPVLDVEDLNGVVVQCLTVACARGVRQDDAVLVLGKKRVDVELERSARQLGDRLEVREHLLLPMQASGK